MRRYNDELHVFILSWSRPVSDKNVLPAQDTAGYSITPTLKQVTKLAASEACHCRFCSKHVNMLMPTTNQIKQTPVTFHQPKQDQKLSVGICWNHKLLSHQSGGEGQWSILPIGWLFGGRGAKEDVEKQRGPLGKQYNAVGDLESLACLGLE